MSETSKIEWTDSTFNPWIGCTKISPGCDHCYAERDMDIRRHRVKWGAGQPRSRTSPAYWKQPLRWNAGARFFGECQACGHRGTRKQDTVCDVCGGYAPEARRRVFCASLADVFDNDVDPAWRLDLFTLIASTPELDWLLLTKRIGNAEAMIADVMRSRPWNAKWPWPNVWLGATIVNQEEADRDIPKLLLTPAAVRFLSCEPLLGPIDLTRVSRFGRQTAEFYDVLAGDWVGGGGRGPMECKWNVDWVIAGGESGPRARPAHPDWIRSLRDQCAAASVPFLFKQWGEWAPHRGVAGGDYAGDMRAGRVVHLQGDGREPDGHFRKGDAAMGKVGKKAAGRTLDGREHSEFPRTA